ncbi:DNA polymerase delta, subunit 4 [Entophlyctis helioformis]|nr:DNA polymerase delta, subunit 4 [Entophlyctis helioformis]
MLADRAELESTLRAFDLSSRYGPCMGVTRLERWQRACNLGLDPPRDIRLALESLEALKDDAKLQQSIWHDLG